MKKRMIAIAAATMATMMMATPVLAEDYKIGISKYYEENRPLLRREEHPEAILCQRFRRALLHGEGSREAPADPPVKVSWILAGRYQGDAGGRCR